MDRNAFGGLGLGLLLVLGGYVVTVMGCVGDTSGTPNDAGGGDSGSQDTGASDGPASDAGSDVTDAAVAACDPAKAFGAPQPLQGFATTANEESAPHLAPDELTLYFSGAGGSLTDGSSQADLFVASRVKRTDPFGTPKPLAINTTFNEWDPSVSSDGLTLIYGFNNYAHTRVWFATRNSTLADFSGAAALAGVASSNTSDDDQNPFVTADGAELWFASNRSGGQGLHDIYAAPKSGSTFANPVVQSTLSSPAEDVLPTLSADRLTIYLSSNRTGTMGGLDIWRAIRVSTQDAFPTPTIVAELNSASDEYPGWLSPDNCRLYMTSLRTGTRDIYVATRTP